MPDNPLVQALKQKKENDPSKKTEALLQMILEQVTKVADYFDEENKEEDSAEPVVTQESHVP